MNFKLFTLVAASSVLAIPQDLTTCNGEKWVAKLTNALYVPTMESFITTGYTLVKKSDIPNRSRVVGPHYAGDKGFFRDRLTIEVDENDRVINFICV